MPELAEVEYFRKRWDPGLGDVVVAVQVHGKKRIFRGTDVPALKREVSGQKLLRSRAHGKQMLFEFSGDNWLGIHLGMSGRLRVEAAGFKPETHDHLVFRQASRALVLSDARQFGRVRFSHSKETPVWWPINIPEIHSTEFTKTAMRKFVRRHGRAPIKSILLLQPGFPGIGNWMADEILWRAHIAPQQNGGALSAARLDTLWRIVRFVARTSLRTVGRDDSDLPKGWLLHERWKLGGKCPIHQMTLHRATIGGRTTAWCPRCQR